MGEYLPVNGMRDRENVKGTQTLSQTVNVRDDSYVLTLEEIAQPCQGGRQARRDADERRRADRQALQDRCLLGLSAGAGSGQSGAGRDGGPAAAMRRHSAHGAARGPWRVWWPNRCGRSPWSRRKIIRASNISAKPAKTPIKSFLGVPLIDRGVLQGVLVVQTTEPRIFREDEIRMLAEAAAQVAPVVSEARTLDRFIAPVQERLWALARNLWWSWDHDSSSSVPRSRSASAGGSSITIRSRCLAKFPWRRLERRAAELVLHSRINYAYRRQREYLQADRTWGARHAGVLRPRPVAYFSAEFGLHESIPIYSGGLGVLAGDHIKSASDLGYSAGRHRPVLRPGIFPAAPRSRRLAAGRIHCRPTSTSCPWSRRSARTASPSPCRSRRAAVPIRAKVWRVKVGRCDLLLLDSNVEGNAPEDRELTSRLYGGDRRIRIRQELLLGVGGFRALKAMGITPGVLHLNEGHSGFAVLEAIRSRMQEEGHRLRRRRCRAFRAKWSSPRTRRCPPATTASAPT